MGFDDYIHPYSSARGQDILRGVNYASAAAGIRDETGQQLVFYKMPCLRNNCKRTFYNIFERYIKHVPVYATEIRSD